MNLHHDKEVFKELVVAAANELAISASVIVTELIINRCMKNQMY